MSEYREEMEQMQTLTAEHVGELMHIWTGIFDAEMCRENLRKLAEHAKNFYAELVGESLAKRDLIEKEIAELRAESQTLSRLLHVDVHLPSAAGANFGAPPPPLLVLQADMDRALGDLREQLRSRREQICELLLQQETLCEELGEPPRALLDDPLPTADELREFSAHLDELRDERVSRLNRLSALRREIKQHRQTLELDHGGQTEAEQRLVHQRAIKLNSETFEALERLRTRYAAQVAEVRELIDVMRRKLATLWERLDVAPEVRDRFERRACDYNQRSYDLFYAELQRCEQLRSANVKRFVQLARTELMEWWERTLKSEQQRARFSNFNSSCYTDDLLVLHEMELEDLKLYYEQNREIFGLYADRKILWERMCALEAKASEPNRYNNRGGQLLKEERERKTIATKLPKIELEITELVRDYEQRHGGAPFLVYGANILELMAEEWARKREEKEKISSARKQAATPASSVHSRSQMGVGGGRTPMSVKNNASSVSSLRKTPSSSSLYSGPAGGTALASTTSGHKRKLNAAEQRYATPVAKRSLMHALNSPSVFLKPGTTRSGGVSSTQKRRFKSPRVLATTIRRKSGRLSAGNIKKRSSTNKSGGVKNGIVPPKIVVQECTSSSDDGGGGGDDTYNSFEKCIEPAARSSILQCTLETDAGNDRVRRMQKIATNENERLAQLPRPKPQSQTPSRCRRIPVRTPSKRAGGDHHASSSVHSPAASSSASSRKLTTRNLPIII